MHTECHKARISTRESDLWMVNKPKTYKFRLWTKVMVPASLLNSEHCKETVTKIYLIKSHQNWSIDFLKGLHCCVLEFLQEPTQSVICMLQLWSETRRQSQKYVEPLAVLVSVLFEQASSGYSRNCSFWYFYLHFLIPEGWHFFYNMLCLLLYLLSCFFKSIVLHKLVWT